MKTLLLLIKMFHLYLSQEYSFSHKELIFHQDSQNIEVENIKFESQKKKFFLLLFHSGNDSVWPLIKKKLYMHLRLIINNVFFQRKGYPVKTFMF